MSRVAAESASPSGLLHVLNGDATRLKLERSGIPGDIAVWADVLHDGPVLLLGSEEWRRLRARYIASQGYLREEAILEQMERWDERLASWALREEVVFWLEHDLFDQLLLIRHLHWLADVRPPASIRFSLICIGSFPGVPDFAGLGQLAPQELATLLDTRKPIGDAEIELGARAWTRLTASDPRPLAALLHEDTSVLPYFAGALRRFLEDYPDIRTGLARSERQILEAVAAGTASPEGVFRATQQMEERVFMGDWTCWAIVRRLASGQTPLLHADVATAGPAPPDSRLQLTDHGRAVLEGGADYVALNGIERWMGGVHLTDGRWRWNGDTIVAID